MSKKQLYQVCMMLGQATGCHQRPDRSFFFCGKQFPVCARCTGVFIGEILGLLLFKVAEISNILVFVFLGIMLLDWGIQYITKTESTNCRRLISGLLCGYAFANFVLKVLRLEVYFLHDLVT